MTKRPRAVLAFGPPSLVGRTFTPEALGRITAALDVDVDQVVTETGSGAARRLISESVRPDLA